MPFYSGITFACLLVLVETDLITGNLTTLDCGGAAEGESFAASDGCNTCVCINGVAACTLLECHPIGQGCKDIVCPAVWSPVCGADGKTYSNFCSACGVDVACEGECPCSGGLGEFCGDEKCNLKCKGGEKCVENEEVQCVQAPCCPRWTCQGTNCESCESMVQGGKCGEDGGPFRMNCTDCCRASSQCAEWRCDAGGWLCQKTCPAAVGCEDVRKCNMAFGKGEVGVCIQTNKEGWNVKNNIDWSAPMKTGLCKSKDDTDANCCGCFKEKVDRCEDPKCVSIPKKKIERKCIKKSEDAPANFFNTGKKCLKRDDCLCFQNCKTTKKCQKSGGECLGKPPKWPYQKAAVKPCDKKKKCSCYIPITSIITG